MISPLKDIVIAVTLGVGAGMVWQNYKNEEMDRISRFYSWNIRYCQCPVCVDNLRAHLASISIEEGAGGCGAVSLFSMRLYVHYEAPDDADAWTKRLTLPPVDEPSSAPSVRAVLRCFFAAYAAKFRHAAALELADLDVFVETDQDIASRRRLRSLDVSVALVGGAGGAGSGLNGLRMGSLGLFDADTCDFELVVTRKPNRKVLGPAPPPPKPTPVAARKKCTQHNGTSHEENEGGRDPKLRSVLELAAAQMKQQKFRAARELHRTLVLPAEATNPEALLALGDILLANGRHAEAAKSYFLKCWRLHGCPSPPPAASSDATIKIKAEALALTAPAASKAYARLAFTSALRLAGCYLETRKFHTAVEILDELQVFLRVNSGTAGGAINGGATVKNRAFFPDAKERTWMETQMDVLKARALYDTKNPDDQEKAISLVMHLLPDLQAPAVNLDALLLYAKIAHDRGKKSEALSMALRVLVGKSNDRAVKKALVALLKGPGAMERLQQAVPARSPSSGAAYAFIATILKDFGAMEKSLVCFRMAQLSDPHSASYALNHAHALEVSLRYAEAYDVLALFLSGNSMLSVGGGGNGAAQLSAGSFAEILERTGGWDGKNEDISTPQEEMEKAEEDRKSAMWPVEWVVALEGNYAKVTPPPSELDGGLASLAVAPFGHRTAVANKKAAPVVSEVELDLLACFFTIVKILFVNGRLSVLPPLIRVLEPLRLGHELHRTSIRNEQAYYACIAQLLSITEGFVIHPPPPSAAAPADEIYVCGDSHTLATAWREINVHGQRILLRPALVTGLKHWHLRKESTFYPKLNFWRVLASIPAKSRVIFLFGEIDCREGILDAVEKCKYESIEEGMTHTIGIFMEVLADVVEKYEFETYIHPIVPVLDETRALVIQYNQLFQKRVAKSKICK
ncbi:hypothetical protein BBJ28_00009020 [Nothophytophthora sp. Chile5]|nr:hypothetical protein BBJ28_00009020 [Nothophytophthora sp. Chile5]